MSVQTIIHHTIESIQEEKEKLFLKNADNLIFKENYALGKGYCHFEQADASFTHDIISHNNCELNDIIKQQIENYEDECNNNNATPEDVKNCSTNKWNSSNMNNSNTSVLYTLWLSNGNSGTVDEFLTLILQDNNDSVNWDEIQS